MNENQADDGERPSSGVNGAAWLRFARLRHTAPVPRFELADIGELANLARDEFLRLGQRIAALELKAPDRTNEELAIWAEQLRGELVKERARAAAWGPDVAEELDRAKSLLDAISNVLELGPNPSPVEMVGRIADLRQAGPELERLKAWAAQLIQEKDQLAARIVASEQDEPEEEEGEEEDDDDGPTPLEALEVMTARAEKAERQGRADAASIETLKREVKTLQAREAQLRGQQEALLRTVQEREATHTEAVRQAQRDAQEVRRQAERINSVALGLQASSIAVLPTGKLIAELQKRVPLLLSEDPSRVGAVCTTLAELERTCAMLAQHEATKAAMRKAQEDAASDEAARSTARTLGATGAPFQPFAGPSSEYRPDGFGERGK